MSKFESIEEVAAALGDGGPHNPDVQYNTVKELVDALVDRGNSPEVFVRHDDHLGLENDVPDELLKSPLSELEKPEFESVAEAIIEQANIILPLLGRELSEDDEDEIKEDQQSRGEDSDD